MQRDWDKYFWETQERYFRLLKSNLEKRMQEAGNPEYAQKAFLLAVNFEQSTHTDEFTQNLLKWFEHCLNLSKTEPISSFLKSYPELREKELKRRSADGYAQFKPVKIQYEYGPFWNWLLRRPKSGSIPIDVPLNWDNPLVYREGERPVVRYLIKYHVNQRLKTAFENLNGNMVAEIESVSLMNDDKCLKIKKSTVGKRKANDQKTALGMEQTALLFHYLGNEKIILGNHTGYQSNEQIALSIEILTGFSHNTVGDELSKPNKSKANLNQLIQILEKSSC